MFKECRASFDCSIIRGFLIQYYSFVLTSVTLSVDLCILLLLKNYKQNSSWKLKKSYELPLKSILLPTIMNEIKNVSAFHLPNRHDSGTPEGEAFAY